MVNHVHNFPGEAPNEDEDVSNYLEHDSFLPSEPSIRAYSTAYPVMDPYTKANSFGGLMSHASVTKSNPNTVSWSVPMLLSRLLALSTGPMKASYKPEDHDQYIEANIL